MVVVDSGAVDGDSQATLRLRQALSAPQDHSGTGLRKLKGSDIWEIRVGLSLRALFCLREDSAEFGFLGTHDEIERYLKSLR